LLAATFPAFAQSPAGRWTAVVEAPDGPVSSFLDLALDGERLTGTFATVFMPEPVPLTDGTFKRNEVTFRLQVLSSTYACKGILTGDELTITGTIIDGPPAAGGPPTGGAPPVVTYTFKRVK
jgi:hypothetical protein